MGQATIESIFIQASSEKIASILADFNNYPQWTDSFTSVEALEDKDFPTLARFTSDSDWMNDSYVLEYNWSEDHKNISWQLKQSSVQKNQTGEITLADKGNGTEVTYSVVVELDVPLIDVLRQKLQSYQLKVLTDLKKTAEK